jgi:competence protein CoiA
LPAARIGGCVEKGFTALVPTGGDDQVLPMAEFLDAAFDRRLRFGVPRGVLAQVAVRAGSLDCWHPHCRKRTQIITAIEVMFGPHKRSFSVADLGDYPGLFDMIRPHLPNSRGFGAIKHRFSKTEGRSYLSNGCAHCDRLMGNYFEHHAWDDATTVCEFPMRLSDQWRDAVEAGDYRVGWGIYNPRVLEGAANRADYDDRTCRS